MSSSARYNLTDGPSADRIWDHAKYSQTSGVEIPLQFTTDCRLGGLVETSAWLILRPSIIQVGHEDGSGHPLMIEGYLHGEYFRGYYHARTRTGFIEIQ